MAIEVTAIGETARMGRPRELFRGDYVRSITARTAYDVAPDGRFLMLKDLAGQEGEDDARPQIVLVQNWFEELEQRVPVP